MGTARRKRESLMMVSFMSSSVQVLFSFTKEGNLMLSIPTCQHC